MNWMKDWIFFFLSFFCQPTGNRHWHFSSRISPIFRAKRQRNGPWRVAAASTGKNSIDESAATEFGSRNAPLVNRKAWFDVYIDPQRRAFATTSRLVGQSKMAPASLWHKIVSFFFFIYIFPPHCRPFLSDRHRWKRDSTRHLIRWRGTTAVSIVVLTKRGRSR